MTPGDTLAPSPPMIPLPKSPAAATAILVAMIGIPTLAIAAWDPHPAPNQPTHHAQFAPAVTTDSARAGANAARDTSASHLER